MQLDLLQRLEADGVLSPEDARAARERYVSADQAPLSAPLRAETSSRFSSVAKVLGAAALAFALVSHISFISPWLTKLPIETYQLSLLAVATGVTLRPDLVWRGHARTLALLATFATAIIIHWMLQTHPACLTWLAGLDKAGWPSASLLGGASLALFAASAAMHESHVLAAAAAACLSWALAAADMHVCRGMPGAQAWLSVAGHGAAVATYISLKAQGLSPRLVYVFTYAVEYYCTAALALLLCLGGTSRSIPAACMHTAVFAAVAAVLSWVHHRLAIRTPASIFAYAAVVMMMVWTARLTASLSTVITLTLCGGVLFGCGLLLDRHRQLLVFEAPQRQGGPAGEGRCSGAASLEGAEGAR